MLSQNGNQNPQIDDRRSTERGAGGSDATPESALHIGRRSRRSRSIPADTEHSYVLQARRCERVVSRRAFQGVVRESLDGAADALR